MALSRSSARGSAFAEGLGRCGCQGSFALSGLCLVVRNAKPPLQEVVKHSASREPCIFAGMQNLQSSLGCRFQFPAFFGHSGSIRTSQSPKPQGQEVSA